MCVCVGACVCMCVGVCKREGEEKREIGGQILLASFTFKCGNIPLTKKCFFYEYEFNLPMHLE